MKLFVVLFMILYLYSLTFGIFMTETFRIPAPLIFCTPLVLLFKDQIAGFSYRKELLFIIVAMFAYYIIGLQDFKYFVASTITLVACALYFHYFVGFNIKRFNLSVLIFYGLLTLSAVVMVLNHFYSQVTDLRAIFMDEEIMQSPSGIAIYQFTFGYQLAALAPFAIIYTFLFHRHLFIKLGVFLICLLFIYLGMQRSVFITSLCSLSLFLLIYYRVKAVFIISIAIFSSAIFYDYVLEKHVDSRYNILTKNMNNEPENNRKVLITENLNIYADYPLGLVFYGKNWSDVIYRNPVFYNGITSHNAYMMFITYLGPFIGVGLLILIFGSVIKIAYYAVKEIRHKNQALLICLCFSFLGIAINALSHNGWLVSADGPTLFLYFAILHLDKIKKSETLNEALEEA
ncbi:MAG TPA: hypothetical protein VL125_12965 [Pelobium sp.]|nr:hypothetical protein [Pelobium sp.]